MFILICEAAMLFLVNFSLLFPKTMKKWNIIRTIKTCPPHVLEGQYESPEPRMGVFDESIMVKIKFEVTMGFYSPIITNLYRPFSQNEVLLIPGDIYLHFSCTHIHQLFQFYSQLYPEDIYRSLCWYIIHRLIYITFYC